ncbi:unnamed protein product [Urochloa decumbens]|uniref:DUF1618 domain-containing protein n=1 Tax=Urochloa decumbens TaxID=240449 RepID=A0ABC8V8Z1_9POAL
MPKRLCRGCSERLCRNCNERFGFGDPGEHLYLVVDDWSNGYNIRKINLPSGSGEGAVQRLPPGFMNIVAPRERPQYFTSAFGTKIVVMHPSTSGIIVPMIDVSRQTVMLGPRTNYPVYPFYFPVGSDKLFTLDLSTFETCRLQLKPEGMFPPPAESDWRWCQLEVPPFNHLDACSYAVNEQKQTIFVSIRGDTVATFSFETGESKWKLHGQWTLPFNDRGYYDRDLDDYVGLSKDSLGYLYFCDMTRTDTDCGLCPCPDVKCSKVKVFNKNPAERHLGATIIYMHHSKFCIVECVSIDDVKADQALQELSGAEGGEASSGSIYMYRVITFTIKFNRRSDLRVKRYRVQCYEVPREATSKFIHKDPVAFWL